LPVRVGQAVVVEVERGIDIGRVARMDAGNLSSQSGRVVHPVLRLAGPEEIEQERRLRDRDPELLRVFKERVEHFRLPMRCIDCEQQLDGNRIHFYFTAEGRVDFRELVRDLARIYRTRIELHQISPRESARRQGGLGPCGRTLCCTSFLQEVETSKVREARLLAPAQTTQRMTGVCGRLLCCLAYQENGEVPLGGPEA
jgi:cell fate regulator YaaT (PSP1 superfamily)